MSHSRFLVLTPRHPCCRHRWRIRHFVGFGALSWWDDFSARPASANDVQAWWNLAIENIFVLINSTPSCSINFAQRAIVRRVRAVYAARKWSMKCRNEPTPTALILAVCRVRDYPVWDFRSPALGCPTQKQLKVRKSMRRIEYIDSDPANFGRLGKQTIDDAWQSPRLHRNNVDFRFSWDQWQMCLFARHCFMSICTLVKRSMVDYMIILFVVATRTITVPLFQLCSTFAHTFSHPIIIRRTKYTDFPCRSSMGAE
jgi:hypothetical protein